MKRSYKGQIGAGFLLKAFTLLITFWICGYILFAILPLFPINNQLTSQGITAITNFSNGAYSIIDNSFFFLFIVILFIGLYDSYQNPSSKKAVADLIGIFIIGYFNLVINNVLPTLSVLTPAVLTPITYTFFNSPYKIIVLYFVMIIAILLNVRGKRR